MTVIVVRDGVMCCDTQVSGDDLYCGEIRKWTAVHPDIGGGFAGFSGELGEASSALKAMADRQASGFSVDAGLWLKSDGTVCEKYGESDWFEYQAPFYAIGSGQHIAFGALHMGATAAEAVSAAIALSSGCGGRAEIVETDHND
jgi:ATP-dependent protease HslVU (ClpYQ) peptidase subunit